MERKKMNKLTNEELKMSELADNDLKMNINLPEKTSQDKFNLKLEIDRVINLLTYDNFEKNHDSCKKIQLIFWKNGKDETKLWKKKESYVKTLHYTKEIFKQKIEYFKKIKDQMQILDSLGK